MTNTISSFPYSTYKQVGADYTVTVSGDSVVLEPSGLVVYNDLLYMASDNGYLLSHSIASDNIEKNEWTIVHNFTNDIGFSGDKNTYDLESVTVAKNKLMIGVEGKGDITGTLYDPHILRYNTVNDHPTSSWDITDVTLSAGGGMETMTFVPASALPSTWKNDYMPYYGGYFFATYQSKKGYIYVYTLPKGNKQKNIAVDNHIAKFPLAWADGTAIDMQASDMCYADGYLFILFDEGEDNDKNELHLFTIGTDTDESGLTHVGASYLPVLNDWDGKDFEGITVDGTNLYLAVDGNPDKKLVVQYTDFDVSDFLFPES